MTAEEKRQIRTGAGDLSKHPDSQVVALARANQRLLYRINQLEQEIGYNTSRVESNIDQIKQLEGQTFICVDGCERYSYAVFFHSVDGGVFCMHSGEDDGCEEAVWLEEVHGDVEDLVGVPILKAYADTVHWNMFLNQNTRQSSLRATFYRLSTIKGTVTFRWLGTSNGFYAEEVTVEKVASKEDLNDFLETSHQDQKERIERKTAELL